MGDTEDKPRSAKHLKKPIVHNYRTSEQGTRPPLTSIGTVIPTITINSSNQTRTVRHSAGVTGNRARSVSEPVTYQGHFVPKYGYQIPEIRQDFWGLPQENVNCRNAHKTLIALTAGARKCSVQCSPQLLDPKPWGVVNTDKDTESESDFIVHPRDTFGLLADSIFLTACNYRCSFGMKYSDIADSIVSYCTSEDHIINAELKAMRMKVKEYQLEESKKFFDDELIDIVEEVQRKDSMNPSQSPPKTATTVPVPSHSTMKSAATAQSTTNSPSPLSHEVKNNEEEEEEDQRRGRRHISSKWSRGSIDVDRETTTATSIKEVQGSKSRSRIRELLRRSKSRHNSSFCSGSFRRSFSNLHKRSSNDPPNDDTDTDDNEMDRTIQEVINGTSNFDMDVLNTALEGTKNPYIPTTECRGLERLIDALMKAD